MTIHTVQWIIFGLALVSVAATGADYLTHSRRGAPYPAMSRAFAISGVGYALLPVSRLVPRDTIWPWIAMMACVAFLGAGFVLLRRSRQGASKRPAV